MIRETYENLLEGQEIRKNLITLRQELKEETNKRALLYYLAGDYALFYKLLQDEDAKVRKNVALIMGELETSEFVQPLYEAYQKEEKLFIKKDYLVALGHLDYSSLIEGFKERLDFLTKLEVEETNRKHVNEEIRTLSALLMAVESPDKHKFIGYNELSDLILLTNRDHKDVTLKQVKQGHVKEFNAGVLVRTKDLNEILNIRTYSDLLFHFANKVENDPLVIAKTLCEKGLVEFLKKRHKGDIPFYFRIELKSKMPLDKKSILVKKIASELERVSERALINSTSHYECEIRLVESKEGLFNVLLKLYTIEDLRFDYRKNVVAASINPVTAALIAELSAPYLKENAQVLDPFCGVGTMLIERNKRVPASPLYAIDSFGEAIDKGIENARRDETLINFINRDFFDFKHDYLFDEIFTNMPAQSGRKTEEDIALLYEKFFEKASEVLKDEGIIVMYTRNQGFVQNSVRRRPQYRIEANYEISKKEGAYVYILRLNKKS